MIFFNGDIIFHERILKNIMESAYEDCLVADEFVEIVDDAMKVCAVDGRIEEIGKKIGDTHTGHQG